MTKQRRHVRTLGNGTQFWAGRRREYVLDPKNKPEIGVTAQNAFRRKMSYLAFLRRQQAKHDQRVAEDLYIRRLREAMDELYPEPSYKNRRRPR